MGDSYELYTRMGLRSSLFAFIFMLDEVCIMDLIFIC